MAHLKLPDGFAEIAPLGLLSFDGLCACFLLQQFLWWFYFHVLWVLDHWGEESFHQLA